MKKVLALIFALCLLALTACATVPSKDPAAKPSHASPSSSGSGNPFFPHASDATETPSPSAKPSPSSSVKPSPSASSKPSPSASASPSQSAATTPLSKDELAFFADYFNEFKNNGFLLSSYTKPSEIDLNAVLYGGAEVADSLDKIPQAEQDAYLKTINDTELWGDLLKLTSKQLDAFLMEKLGITYAQTAQNLKWKYLKQYDAYYRQVSDTNYTKYTAVSGTKTSAGVYVIQCTGSSGEFNSYTVTLKKSGDHYLFVSNVAKK